LQPKPTLHSRIFAVEREERSSHHSRERRRREERD